MAFLDSAPDQIDEAAQVQEAAQAAAQRTRGTVRPLATGIEDVTPPSKPADALPSDQTDVLPSDRNPDLAGEEAGLRERFRLNQLDAFYRGSLAGAGRLRAMSSFVASPDPSDTPPEVKKARDRQREEYHGIVADLARYDLMAPFGDTVEATVAFGGQLTGGMMSPESVIGAPARGATILARTLKAAAGQAAVQLVTDPAVQGLSITSGVQKEYEPLRTALAPVVGAVVGGGLHLATGELLPAVLLRQKRAEMGAEDPSMRTADDVGTPKAPESITPAPERKPIDVAAPEFESWFQNSRVADEQGKPVPVFHGTSVRGGGEVFNEFDKAKLGSATDAPSAKEAFFFTEDPELAKSYADSSNAYEDFAPLRIINKITLGGYEKANEAFVNMFGVSAKREGKVLSAYLAAKNPLTVDYGGVEYREQSFFDVLKAAKEGGNDSVLFKNAIDPGFVEGMGERPANIWAVFEPEQIKVFSKEGAARTAPASEPDALALAQRAGGGTLPMERARPDTGVPSATATASTAVATIAPAPSPGKEVAIRSLQQQAFDFADAIGFPLRQGRIGNKDASGIYKQTSGAVRVREVPDFEVVAHEGGHAIEAKAGVELTALTNRFSTELAPLVTNPAAYDPAQYVKEGFAEWIRRYIGNPAHAESIAPGFAPAFRDFMAKNQPDMLAAIDNAGAAYRAYLDAPSVDAVGAVRRSQSENQKGWRAAIARVKEDGLASVTKTVMQNIYHGLLDDKAPVTRAVRDIARLIREQEGGLVELKGVDNPDVTFRLLERSHQAAVRDMMDGVRGYHDIVPNGPSLSAALEVATGGTNSGGWGKWDPVKKADFSDFLIARMADFHWSRFKNGEIPNPPAAFSQADARVAMAELERANPSFRQASDMVHAWTRELLRKQYDGGLIGADLYNKLTQWDFYVPMMRDLSDRPLASKGGSSPDGPGMTETVRRFKGSSRDVIDPLESLMTQAFLVNRTLQHNDIVRSFVRLAERAKGEGGRFVEAIPAKEARKYTFDLQASIERLAKERGVDPDEVKALSGSLTDMFGEDPIVGSFFRQEPAGKRGEPIVFYKEGGELRAARFMSGEEGHALYETLTALPKPLTDAWSMTIGATTSIVRTGIVTNPMFALTNYIRDQFAVAILRKDYIPIISGFKGLVAEGKQSESAVLYGFGGGVSGGASITPVERAIKSDVDALAKKGYLVNRVTSFKGLTELAGFTESGTRNSVFGKVFAEKKVHGLSDYEAMIEAAFQAQDILDFSRHGSRTEAIRKYLPFINAYLQGMDKAYRTTIEPLIRKVRNDEVLTADVEALAGVGRGAARVLNNATFALFKIWGVGGVLGAGWAALHADSEAYRDTSPKIKGTHVVVPMGNKILLWPKPFELGIGFTLGEYAYQGLAQKDPRAAAQFAEAAWDSLTQSNPIYDIPLIKTAFELKTGKNLFTGRDIVPDTLQRLLPEQQYTERTSSMAKVIGKTIGVSPIKVDYAVGSSFGLWGRDVMSLSSGIDPNAPAQSWEDRVFIRRLLKDPTRTSDVTTKFWDFMGQTTGKYNQNVATYDDMVKKFQDGDAKDFLSRLPASERAFVIMKSAADEDGRPAFKADEKRLYPLQRAYDAVTLLNGLRRELSNNAFKTFESGQQAKLDPVARRDLIENIRELGQMEMRNSFVMMKEPGYTSRPLFDVQGPMDKIRAISPQVADEIATRYASAKIYKTGAVAQAYPKLRDALVRDGSEADLGDIADAAQADGYEFGGERVKKPQKRRVQIPAAP